MSIVFDWLLPQNFLPHGHCYLWRPDVLWLHVISDGVIAASYYAIPLALAYFVHRRRAVLPYWWMPVLFATFIFLCGTTHVLNIWTVWRPDYVVDGLVKLATALASVSTAVLVFASLPQAMALRTPIELQSEVEARTTELSAANEHLRQEVAAREEDELRMRLTLEASGAASWLIDYRAANEHFDARSCELAGLDATQSDWPAGTFCKLLHPDDRERMQLVFQQTRAAAGPGPLVEYRIVTASQEVRWLQGAGIVQRDAQGEPERFIGVSTDITQQKNAVVRAREDRETIERQLSEIEMLYRTAPVGLTAFDRELRCLRINEKMAEMNGVPITGSLGRHLRDYIPRELADIAEPQLRRVLEAGEPMFGVENSADIGPGGKRNWLVNYYPWRNTEGNITGVSVAVQDVTEQRRAQEALRESEERLRLAQLTTDAGVWDWNLQTQTLTWSPELEKLYGVASGTVKKDADFRQRVYQADLAGLAAESEAAISQHRRFHCEFRIIREDGEIRWMSSTGAAHYDSSGKPIRVLGTNVDITERKRTEAALAARTRELHQTFDATATGLTRCSRDLHYVAANPAYAEIAGLPLQQIIGRPIIDVMGREGFEKIRPYVERVLGGESVEYEAPVPFSKGGTRRLHVAYAPWREVDGSVSGWVASVTDVTARYEAEEKLKAANRQKDEFLAMLAHELRNPLAPIRNASDLLDHCLGTHPQAKVPLAILHRQTRQLTRLVDDLLDVGRISQGQINLKKEIIDIGAVLDQAVETIQVLVQTKLHRLTIHKPFGPVYVNGDLARLVQSLGNILHNAAKYTDPGGEIEVDVKESNGDLTIAVRDNGSGIAPDLLPQVFDLFTQGRPAVDRSEGGLGIGLTVVKQLIQLHGGFVSAKSAGIGCGTTVTVHLPIAQQPSAPQRKEVASKVVLRRILVVDDNEDAANSLAMVLQLEGHEVSTAYTASGALTAVEQHRPEVVFLDIGLPLMDGYEVARRLRAKYGAACPRLIARTGYGQPEDRARALAAGFDAHLTKPVDPQELQRVISDSLEAGATGT